MKLSDEQIVAISMKYRDKLVPDQKISNAIVIANAIEEALAEASMTTPEVSEAVIALTALEDRLKLIYRLCCGTAPKQSVGELVAVMQKMPEWEVLRSMIKSAAPEWTPPETSGWSDVKDPNAYLENLRGNN